MKNLTGTSVDSNGELLTASELQQEQENLYQEKIFDIGFLFQAIQIVTMDDNEQHEDTHHIIETLARLGSNIATEIKKTF